MAYTMAVSETYAAAVAAAELSNPRQWGSSHLALIRLAILKSLERKLGMAEWAVIGETVSVRYLWETVEHG